MDIVKCFYFCVLYVWDIFHSSFWHTINLLPICWISFGQNHSYLLHFSILCLMHYCYHIWYHLVGLWCWNVLNCLSLWFLFMTLLTWQLCWHFLMSCSFKTDQTDEHGMWCCYLSQRRCLFQDKHGSGKSKRHENEDWLWSNLDTYLPARVNYFLMNFDAL